jgi:hypothetical protein
VLVISILLRGRSASIATVHWHGLTVQTRWMVRADHASSCEARRDSYL